MNITTINNGWGACEQLYEAVSMELVAQGYSIKPLSLPLPLATLLKQHADSLKGSGFKKAGTGRAKNFHLNKFIRSDKICWINGEAGPERLWLDWVETFRVYLNKRLFLGLFSFESHFAWYQKGEYYKRHLDTFLGESNRVLSLVVYLNDGWLFEDKGELVLYKSKNDLNGTKVLPTFGTIVVFLSKEFPHEVLPSYRERLSIAGWFSVNKSLNGKLDPPT